MDCDLRDLFRASLQRFVELERSNIASGVSERSLCARLAMVLESLALDRGLNGYFADVEYNRGRRDKVKAIIDAQYRVLSVTCDLILHARGQREPDNLIAVEMKRHSHRQDDKDSDRERLRALTGAARELIDYRTGQPVEHVSGYAFGYFIELKPGRRFLVEEYVGGRQVDGWMLSHAGVCDEGPPEPGRRRHPDVADLFAVDADGALAPPTPE